MQPGVFNSLFIIWRGYMIDLWFFEMGMWGGYPNFDKAPSKFSGQCQN